MQLVRNIILILSVLLLAGASGAVAGPKAQFGRLTMADGLPEDGVLQIAQDRHGFLWLGTQNGLVRYDGREFVTFKPDEEDPGAMHGRIVTALYEDRQGSLWVGTRRGGLNRLDPASGRFDNYRHDPDDEASLSFDAVSAIFEDRDGNLWVGTGEMESPTPAGGLNRLDAATGTFTRYRHDAADPRSLAHDVVTAIAEAPDGGVWLATAGGGLHLYDADGDDFTRFRHDDDDRGSLASDWVFDLTFDAGGVLWVATADGLDRLDAGGSRFRHYRRDPQDRGALASNYVSSLFADPDGSLWVGTWSGALHKFDVEREVFARFENDPRDPRSLPANQGITGILRDRSEILWVAAWRGGLAKLDRYGVKFPHFRHEVENADSLSSDNITALTEDRAGNLWIATRDGLNRFNPRTESYTHYRHSADDPGSVAEDWTTALLEDTAGSLWVGTHGSGLDRFNPGTSTFTHYLHDPDDPGTLGGNWVTAVAEDRAGGLWVGGLEGGLSRLDPEEGRFRRYRHRPDEAGSLAHDNVRTIYEDREGALWVGTESGLSRYDPDTDSFVNYHDPVTGLDIICSVYEDRAGRLWVGTFNGGLHRFDRATGTSRPYTQKHGLAHDSVYHIQEDDEGALWLSTGFGLSRFDPEAGRFRNYDESDGLAAHRFDGGALRTRAGELLFGSANGINAFFPGEVRDNPHPPQVVLTGLRLFNRLQLPGPDSVLDHPLAATESFELSHRDHMVTFEFAALHFGDPEENRFAYRLLPLEREWRQPTLSRQANYTSLRPGSYEFQVKAANGDGVWNEEGTSVRLTVHPPWWHSWWAWSSYLLLAAAAIVTGDRFQRRRVVARGRWRVREEHSRLRAEAAELQAKAAEAQARALQSENERKSRELEEARQLQLSLLPEGIPSHPDLEIATYMKTATEVGGDFYDFHLADDGALTVAIGDATGHGTKAGMMVTATKVLFNLLAGQADSVELLHESTRALKQLNLQNLFMALSVAKIRGARLELAGAGMPPALIRRAADGSVDEIASHGAPLGSFQDYPYETLTAELAPGDTLVLISDGLPEMIDPDGEVFGYERVARVMRQADGSGPQAMIDRLAEAAARWARDRPQDDDLTLVVVRRRDG